RCQTCPTDRQWITWRMYKYMDNEIDCCDSLATTFVVNLESQNLFVTRNQRMDTTSTTQKVKPRYRELNYVKPLSVDQHPRYIPYSIKFNPNQHRILEKGSVKEPGRKKVLVDCSAECDTPVPMRDGLHVYCDIYRPVSSNETPVPAV